MGGLGRTRKVGGRGGGIAVKRKRGKVAKSVDLAVERIDFVALSEEEGQDGASEGAGDQDGGEREDKGRNDAGGEESAAAAVAVTAVSRRVGGLVESDTESEGAEKEDEEQHQGVTAVNIDAGADTESDNEEDVVVSPKQVVMSAMAYPVPSANGMSMAQMTRSSSNSAGDASPLAADGVAVGKDGSNGQTGAIEVVATALAGGGVASASTAMHGMGLGDSSILGLDASSSSAVPGLTFGTGNNSMSMSLGGQSYASQLQHTQQSQQQQQQQQLQLLQQLQQQMQQMQAGTQRGLAGGISVDQQPVIQISQMQQLLEELKAQAQAQGAASSGGIAAASEAAGFAAAADALKTDFGGAVAQELAAQHQQLGIVREMVNAAESALEKAYLSAAAMLQKNYQSACVHLATAPPGMLESEDSPALVSAIAAAKQKQMLAEVINSSAASTFGGHAQKAAYLLQVRFPG